MKQIIIRGCELQNKILFHGSCVFVITRICIITRNQEKCKCEMQMQERR
nr:MAG TPA: hypothetical protein [Caudoviricetes sp.]